jgi:tripartite-type tricarboxylate transporter receptor subunit TctC
MAGRSSSGAKNKEKSMITRTRLPAVPLGVLTSIAALASTSAVAQTPNLAGKTVTMIIGFGPGGGYDRWGRVVAAHIGKHLPGKPTVISQNMPGGGSFNAANNIYTVAPKDGTAMAIIARDAPLGPISGMPGARFDSLKMTWLGTPTTETNVCFAHKRAKVKTFDDLLKNELIIGNTGVGTGTYSYPKALNGLIGTKFKLISGFPSSTNVMLAIERGEVDGLCESWDSAYNKHPTWFKDGTINVLFQAGAELNPEIKAPSIFELVKDPKQKQALDYLYAGQGIGRPFVAPPGMSPAVTKMVRDAFSETMKDPAFVAEAKKSKLDLEPHDGVYLENLIKRIYGTPKDLVKKIAELIK